MARRPWHWRQRCRLYPSALRCGFWRNCSVSHSACLPICFVDPCWNHTLPTRSSRCTSTNKFTKAWLSTYFLTWTPYCKLVATIPSCNVSTSTPTQLILQFLQATDNLSRCLRESTSGPQSSPRFLVTSVACSTSADWALCIQPTYNYPPNINTPQVLSTDCANSLSCRQCVYMWLLASLYHVMNSNIAHGWVVRKASATKLLPQDEVNCHVPHKVIAVVAENNWQPGNQLAARSNCRDMNSCQKTDNICVYMITVLHLNNYKCDSHGQLGNELLVIVHHDGTSPALIVVGHRLKKHSQRQRRSSICKDRYMYWVLFYESRVNSLIRLAIRVCDGRCNFTTASSIVKLAKLSLVIRENSNRSKGKNNLLAS